MGPLRAERGVVAVALVDDGVVAVDVEHPAGDVTEESLETAWLPSLSGTDGEQEVPLKGNI
jgi:hypothetical protein